MNLELSFMGMYHLLWLYIHVMKLGNDIASCVCDIKRPGNKSTQGDDTTVTPKKKNQVHKLTARTLFTYPYAPCWHYYNIVPQIQLTVHKRMEGNL